MVSACMLLLVLHPGTACLPAASTHSSLYYLPKSGQHH